MDREDCWFVDLAEELVLRIAAWLPIPAIVAFSATNQRLHRLCHDPSKTTRPFFSYSSRCWFPNLSSALLLL